MKDVVGDVGGAEDKIAHDPAIVRYPIRNAKGAIKGQGRGCGMAGGAHPAYALGYSLRIAGVSTLQDELYPPK